MSDPSFKAAVGLSREWDAYGAGVEVAQDTLQKLGAKPDFVLLFATIHYEKHGGFKKFLEGVWDILPEGTPLIGGTVAGFINPQGCYTRGATALAVNYPNMDVAVGIGRNTKRNPKKAGKNCANMINEWLDKAKFEKKFIIDIISGPSVPSLPGIGTRRVIKSDTVGKFLESGLRYSSAILQRGFGREDEVLKSFGEVIREYPMTGTSTSDDNNLRDNFSFVNREVLRNVILALAISTDMEYAISGGHGFIPATDNMKISKKSLWGYIIKEIDKNPALKKFFEISSWSDETLNDKQFYRRSFFYPLGFPKNDGTYSPVTIGAIWGDNLICGCTIPEDNIVLLTSSGKRMLAIPREILDKVDFEPYLGLFFSCAIRLESLGSNIFVTHKLLKNYFKEKCFLLTFGFGENVGIPPHEPTNFNVSIQSLVLGKNN
jgi:hypothetical protein